MTRGTRLFSAFRSAGACPVEPVPQIPVADDSQPLRDEHRQGDEEHHVVFNDRDDGHCGAKASAFFGFQGFDLQFFEIELIALYVARSIIAVTVAQQS